MACNHNRGCSNTQTPCTSVQEKICVQVNKVFDACVSQFADENRSLVVDFPTHVDTFLGGKSIAPATVYDVIITPQAESVCSRVQFKVDIPMQIYASNACGATIIGYTTVTYERDLLLRVPTEAIIPTEIQCNADIVAVNGKLKCNNTLICTLCTTLIIKVVAPVEILINSAGYPALPNCQEYTEDLCAGVFNKPIYPV